MKKSIRMIFVAFLITVLSFLSACGSGLSEQKADPAAEQTDLPEEQVDIVNMKENRETEEADRTQEESAALLEEGKTEDSLSGEEDDTPKVAPTLPETGKQLADFVPEGWELWDSVELDFNEDGITDHVGVLQEDPPGGGMFQGYPRILFAIAGGGTEGFRLDFQDVNLIRTRDEGGVYGDPYQPLTAEGASFATHAYGGSAWRWWEDFTYTYRKGTWWLTSSEEGYGYGDYVTDYKRNDWERGVGIRKKRSSDFDDMEENWERMEGDNWDSIAYDLEYEVPLDDMQTLEQAGKRWWLATDRVTDWEIREIVFAKDVTHLAEDRIKSPEKAFSDYCDEDCMLYTFSDDMDADERLDYLVMYRFSDNVLSVLREEETAIDDPKLYKGKIYYTTEIVEEVAYQEGEDGKERIEKQNDTVGISLHRMEPDGSGMETVFTYRYPKAEQEVLDDRIPYLSLSYEIGGDELFAEVYVGDEPHPFYRMRTDGSGCKRIGQTPKELETVENPYFPAKEYVPLKIHAEYYDQGFVDEIADAEISRIKIYKKGCIYKLTMYIVPDMFSWYFKSGENMSMYFYVTADKIYWILPYAQPEPGGKAVNFYDNDDLLVKTLDTDEKLQSSGVLELVCQKEDMREDNFSMTQEGNRITYYYSETKESGEPGGRYLFVWEIGKGLVEFGTGWGPGPMDVHIDKIREAEEG